VPELDSPPSIPSLYGKAALGAVLRRGGGDELPALELALREAELEAGRVADYSRVCGFTIRNTVPGTFPHLLAFPLQLKLMTEKGFPFPVLGLVHIGNQIEVLGELPVGAALDFKVHAEDLRDHPRGRQLDLVAEAGLDGETVWRGRSNYLKIERSAQQTGEAGDGETGSALDPMALWSLPGDLGRRYGSVSGDRNPIHMSALSAKAFGFPTAIIHGMWTKARALAAFEGSLPDAYRVAVEFRSPLRIPGKARLLGGKSSGESLFEVQSPDGERVHAVGSIAALA
jgi:MaoC dehydratase-like protein